MMQRRGMMPSQSQPVGTGAPPDQDVMEQMAQMMAMMQKDPAIMVAMMQDPAMQSAMAELMRGFLELRARGDRPPNGLEMVQRGLAAGRMAPTSGPGVQMPPSRIQ